MKRRDFSLAIAAVLVGLRSAAQTSPEKKGEAEPKTPRHICKGMNECRGQGYCMHGCGNNGCGGKNDCKGKGGCAAPATHHACKGKNDCKAIGGCASGDQGCASFNTCKGKGGCEVPLNYEHDRPRLKNRKS